MKIAATSILIGILFFAICLGLAYLTSMDWEHEMADTEASMFFLKLTFLSMYVLPPSLLPQGLGLGAHWIISALLNSLVVYSFLFTFSQFRAHRRQTRTQQDAAVESQK